MQTFYKCCLVLLIVGGLNWGLVGLFQFDFVGWLLGGQRVHLGQGGLCAGGRRGDLRHSRLVCRPGAAGAGEPELNTGTDQTKSFCLGCLRIRNHCPPTDDFVQLLR